MEPTKRPRGRPRNPDAMTAAERQRAYRARMAAAGKVVRIVDANALDRAAFDDLREQHRQLALKLELREERVVDLEKRNAWLESELRRVERLHDIVLKDKISGRAG